MGTSVKVFISSGILCIVIIYIIFGPYMLIKRTGDVIEYHQNVKCVIEVPAVVTYIKDSLDGEGGTNYYIYASYSHEGKDYNNVYWRMTNREDMYSIGSSVIVKISENDPGKIFTGAFDNYSLFFFHLIFTLMGIFAAVITYLSVHNPDFGNKENK